MKKIIFIALFVVLFESFAFADIKVTPYGAAETVSGSCFLFESGDIKALVDCGIFMNEDEAEENQSSSENFPKELTEAQFLVLTHAHIDHSGKIPLLINKGFKGKIYSTPATKELAFTLYKNRSGFDLIERQWFWSQSQKSKAQRSGYSVVAHWTGSCRKDIKETEQAPQSMTIKQLEAAENVHFSICKNCCEEETAAIAKYFVTKEYNEKTDLGGAAFQLINAGHIPGSASVMIEAEGKKVLFSGDLGSGYSRLTGNFDVPEKADLIFMEATYGGEKQRFGIKEYDTFQDDLDKAVKKGKTVWIPALSFNRTQKVLYELLLMQENGKLSKEIPIYSVSPSANAMNAIYKKEAAKKEGTWFLPDIYQKGKVIPDNAKLQMIRSYDKQMILLSSSGDMDMGMSEKMISKMIPQKNVSIMIVNFVKPDSNAGRLLTGKPAKNGMKSAASIKKYEVFSDHPDFEMLQKWLGNQNKETPVYIIHSDAANSLAAEKLLRKNGWKNAGTAKQGQPVLLQAGN